MVEKVVEKTVEKVVDKKLHSLMEDQIMPQFEYMHEQFHYMHARFHDVKAEFSLVHKELGIIKNTMVTKSFLEERLDRFQVDHGLSYRNRRKK